MLIIEICVIAPHTNAELERFFSTLKYVKSNLRSTLESDILNALMRVKMLGMSIEEFSRDHCRACVERWYTANQRRPHQRPKKRPKKRPKRDSEGAGSESDTTDSETDDD